MSPSSHNLIITLMFLSGLLFLGLNLIARHFVYPGPRGSKQLGYTLITLVSLAMLVTYQHQILVELGFAGGKAKQLILFGLALPVFLTSLVYFRIKKSREGNIPPKSKGTHESD